MELKVSNQLTLKIIRLSWIIQVSPMLSQACLRGRNGYVEESKKDCKMASFENEENGPLEKQNIHILEPSEGTQPCQHLDFSPGTISFLSSRNVK